jgi:hypothetical protein
MAKKPKLILPPGVAVFPHLNEVDVYQPLDKKGRPSGAQKRQYITYIRFEPAVLKQVQANIKAAAKALGVSDDDLATIKMPFKMIKKDKEGKEKEMVLKATSGEKFRPAVFDGKNNKLPPSVIIGGGSVLRLDVTPNYYEGFGGGVNLYMNAVQLLKLVEGGEHKSSFEETEGFVYEGTEDEGASGFGETADHNEGTGDDALAF